jgi:hypothetical protein
LHRLRAFHPKSKHTLFLLLDIVKANSSFENNNIESIFATINVFQVNKYVQGFLLRHYVIQQFYEIIEKYLHNSTI